MGARSYSPVPIFITLRMTPVIPSEYSVPNLVQLLGLICLAGTENDISDDGDEKGEQ